MMYDYRLQTPLLMIPESLPEQTLASVGMPQLKRQSNGYIDGAKNNITLASIGMPQAYPYKNMATIYPQEASPVKGIPVPELKDPEHRAKLLFDGKKLMLSVDGRLDNSWDAVSGMPGYQSGKYQNLKNKGPIPEGKYTVSMLNYSNRDEAGIVDNILGWIGRGSFPGGERSWGNERIQLIPYGTNNTYGRGNFFVHGGLEPGSRGCIDLTGQNESFINRFQELQQDVPLEVYYQK